jgi:hypothetical protein
MKPAKNGEAKRWDKISSKKNPMSAAGTDPTMIKRTNLKNPLWNFRDISPEDDDDGDKSSKVKHNIEEKLWPFNAEEALENYQMA